MGSFGRTCGRVLSATLLLAALALASAGCGRGVGSETGAPAGVAPEAPGVETGAASGTPATFGASSIDVPEPQASFLKQHGLTVESLVAHFPVRVPEAWAVQQGQYPEGLYWTLAGEFSKDAGLDLAPLKGQEVEAYRYGLVGGLPGDGDQAQFSYPSNVVLLLQASKVVGAWLEFNTASVGPSVNKRSLKDVTGLGFEDWVVQQGVFQDAGPNTDLAAMSSTDVMRAYFAAVGKRNDVRANACLSPREMLSLLTTNRPANILYNPGFSADNSITANILEARLLSWTPPESRKGPQGHEMVELSADLILKWRDAAFNTPDGKATRFVVLQRYGDLGWKIEGIGTGP